MMKHLKRLGKFTDCFCTALWAKNKTNLFSISTDSKDARKAYKTRICGHIRIYENIIKNLFYVCNNSKIIKFSPFAMVLCLERRDYFISFFS